MIFLLRHLIFTVLFLFPGLFSLAQPIRNSIRIMFYNTENYFDITDDPHTNDNEFLPDSERRWTSFRYRNKTLSLYKTIAAVGEMMPPEIICLSEIENQEVLKQLAYNTPLEKFPYSIVHFDSKDQRGIDVAILYRNDLIRHLKSEPVRITLPEDPSWNTRDILYFKALTAVSSDTLHIFVNHWPSRRGGEKKSEPKRILAATILRAQINRIQEADPCANIIITGDFNDEPSDESLKQTLAAGKNLNAVSCSNMYNLSGILQDNCRCGTYRYKSAWNMLDQFIVSGNLLIEGEKKIRTTEKNVHIASFEFLLTDDEKYGGKKPFSTFTGPVYKGGFSDHLPVYLDLYY